LIWHIYPPSYSQLALLKFSLFDGIAKSQYGLVKISWLMAHGSWLMAHGKNNKDKT